MAKYSELAPVDEAFGRWVREEDAPAPLYPAALELDALERAIEALDPDVRVHRTVEPIYEHCALRLAAKATKLFPTGGLLYAELGVHLSGFGRLGLVAWEWRRAKDEPEPTRAEEPPGAPPARAAALSEGVRRILRDAGVTLVPLAEARREVRVADDPLYDGDYYDITVFEVLFGMGYPERQR